jgi:hypothetical protein
VHGRVIRVATAVRAVCYCKDCQAYARFLASPGVVDPAGGTEVVATVPGNVHLDEGGGALACLSLSGRGLLRWYAGCCNTPIANTPRNPNVPYVGLVHSCLQGGPPSIEASFGRRRMVANAKSARGDARSAPLANAVGISRLMLSLLKARISGSYKDNPFFLRGTSTPVRSVHVLSAEERLRAYGHEPGIG